MRILHWAGVSRGEGEHWVDALLVETLVVSLDVCVDEFAVLGFSVCVEQLFILGLVVKVAPEEQALVADAAAMLVNLWAHAQGETCGITQSPDFVIWMKRLESDAWKGRAVRRLSTDAAAAG